MGFKEGQLFLDSPNGTYYSGQFIHGKLIFQQEKVRSFRGLYVQMHGFCHVHWTTRHTRTVNGKEETYTVDHDSHEDYMNTRVYMLGGEAGEYTIQPGKYEYPFRFQLPDNCPSSFEGIYGHIRYEIKAVIDRAFRFDQEKRIMARVMAPLDLNLDPFCRLPLQLELQKLYHCCCIKSGSSDVSVKLPVAGYCPGQTIPIKLTCSNKGRVEINDIRLSINKKVTFIATSKPGKQILKDKVAEIRKGPVSVNTDVNWSLDLVVPLQDVYNLTICQYIKVEYKFKVHISPKGCHTNSGLSHLIVIGTIPLMEFQDTQPTRFNAVLTHPNPDNSSHSNANPNPDYPPPYPGNLSNPQQMPYETKNSKIPHDVTGGFQSGETEINLPPSTCNAASQDTISLHLTPAITYYAATAPPAFDSPENSLPERKD